VETKEKHFLQLLNEHKGILFKICKIYEEMTLQLWLAFDSFRGESKFSSWMYRVALNTAIVFFKKQKRRPDSEQLSGNFEQIDVDLNSQKEEQLALFYKAVQQLDKVEKALIYLYMENQTHEEIGENLGITAGNARVRLNRIKNKLKEIIKNISYEY